MSNVQLKTNENNWFLPSVSNALTPNTPLIHTSFTYSKWNMGEIFGLNFHLSCHKTFFEIPPCAKVVIFVTE